jgi:hypothetical protein
MSARKSLAASRWVTVLHPFEMTVAIVGAGTFKGRKIIANRFARKRLQAEPTVDGRHCLQATPGLLHQR